MHGGMGHLMAAASPLYDGGRRRVRREVMVTQTREMVPSARDRLGIASDARWLSIRQIAVDLGVSSSTAYKWSARGVPWFPRTIRLHNGDIRVRRDWYEQWLAALEQ